MVQNKKGMEFDFFIRASVICSSTYSGGILLQNKAIGAICRYIVSPLFMLLAINYIAKKQRRTDAADL